MASSGRRLRRRSELALCVRSLSGIARKVWSWSPETEDIDVVADQTQARRQ